MTTNQDLGAGIDHQWIFLRLQEIDLHIKNNDISNVKHKLTSLNDKLLSIDHPITITNYTSSHLMADGYIQQMLDNISKYWCKFYTKLSATDEENEIVGLITSIMRMLN